MAFSALKLEKLAFTPQVLWHDAAKFYAISALITCDSRVMFVNRKSTPWYG